MSFANPTVWQMLEAAPLLQWRKCHDCGHVGLHVDNMRPWVNCRCCGSQDTRNMLEANKELHQLARPPQITRG